MHLTAFDRQLTKDLLNIYRLLPWLTEDNRDSALEELLSQCNKGQQALVIDLLKRFKFIDEPEYRDLLRQIAKTVMANATLTQDNTQLVAFAADDEADSSQALLQSLKSEFAALGWDHPKTANKIGRASRNLEKYPNIILVDEFVGTGKTLESRLKHLNNECRQAVYQNRAPHGYSISVFVVAAMEAGVSRVSAMSVPFSALITLKRGISDHYVGKALRKACKRMYRLECALEPNVHGKKLQHFGYGRSESLYGTNSNAPNNLFPVFWWPYLIGNLRRTTLFHRAESVPE